MDKAFLDQMKKKVEKELGQREAEVVTFWQGEVDKLLHKKTESLSALLQDLKNLSQRMGNRLNVLKRSSDL